MKSIIILVLFTVCPQIVSAQESPATHQLNNVDRAIIFTVQQEIHANHLENSSDVCLGFGHGLKVDEKEIVSELHQVGLKIHFNEWCNRGPRGLVISINAPVRKSAQGTYELIAELGDLRLIRQEGAHFARLLRNGTYTVKCEKGSQPELVSYSQTCCPGTGKPGG